MNNLRRFGGFVLLLCLLLSLPASSVGGRCQFQDADRIRVLSFNIRYGTADDGPDSWPNRKDRVVQVIRHQSPHLIGLQEALRFQIDFIREMLPQFGELGVGRNDGKAQGEYSAILYRKDRFEVVRHGTFWLSDTPEIPGSKSWGNRITRICTWALFRDVRKDREFLLFNTHLDHQSQESRLESAKLLTRRVREQNRSLPVIMTGDLNAGESNPVVRFLTGATPVMDGLPSLRLRDTFRVIHADEKEVSTFNGFGNRMGGEKIDYVFASEEIQVLDAAIVRIRFDSRYPSDHYPVSAELLLPEGGRW